MSSPQGLREYFRGTTRELAAPDRPSADPCDGRGAIYTAVAFLQRSETLITERCTAAGSGGDDLATDQAANAALITAVAVRRGLPARAASIALATSMQESKLRNIGHGDQAGPDSRGLFQQRPSRAGAPRRR